MLAEKARNDTFVIADFTNEDHVYPYSITFEN